MTQTAPSSRIPEIRRIRQVIATAIPLQGPPDSDSFAAAIDVMRALSRAGYQLLRLDEAGRLVGFHFLRPGQCSLCGTAVEVTAWEAEGVCRGCPHQGVCHEPRQRVIDRAVASRMDCDFYRGIESSDEPMNGGGT